MSKALADLASVLGPEPTEAPVSVKKKEEKVLTKKDKFEILSDLNKKLNKQFNVDVSLTSLGKKVGLKIPSISTELPSLDDEVLQCGGIPRGRIIEIYGPESAGKTTLALHLIACEQQNTDNLVAFIDAEHAIDPNYAAQLGVNVNELLISQVDSGEQALEIVEDLVESKCVSLIVIDSVAALVPQAELDGEMGDSNMGLQARLLSQAMRKLRGKAQLNGVTLVFLNQIREKIGVVYGCLHGNELLNFEDGRVLKIRDVVRDKIAGNVRTSGLNGEIIHSPIINWFENGKLQKDEKWYTITTDSAGASGGKTAITVTPNHKVYLFGGDCISSDKVKVGDKLISYSSFGRLDNPVVKSLVYGSLLGDGHIRQVPKRNTAALQLANQLQPEYLQWKLNLLKSLEFSKAGNVHRPCYITKYSYELSQLKSLFYPKENKTNKLYRSIPKSLKLDDLMVAVWYMDDGCLSTDEYHKNGRVSLCVKRLIHNKEQLNLVLSKLNEWMEDEAFFLSKSKGSVEIHSPYINKFFYKIAKFIPPCMQYKLTEKYKGLYISIKGPGISEATLKAVAVTVKKITYGTKKKTRQSAKFDIEIKDNHRYFAGGKVGILVHNSPEVTTGGRALKFFSTVRLDVRKKEIIGDKERPTGHVMRVKCVKNKVGSPMRETLIDLIYGVGFDKIKDLLATAVSLGVIERSGAWYSFEGERIGQGLSNVSDLVKETPELFTQIKAAVVKKKLDNSEKA